jgi:4-hydroxy 2-oxovalerate aldolase
VIRVLDTTLRDGGHLIDGRFTKGEFRKIVADLASSGIDYIEVAWLGPHEMSEFSTFCSALDWIEEELGQVDLGDSKLLFLVRPDQTRAMDVRHISGGVLKTARLAFYHKHIEILRHEIQAWQDLGVEVWLNPIDTPGYSSEEILDVIELANKSMVRCVSIVDTYGALTIDKLDSIYHQFSLGLHPEISIGLHSHDNIQLSLALATHFIQMADDSRDRVVDASLLGMGRAPGNLKLELLIPVLNQIAPLKTYDLNPILSALDSAILPIYNRKPWGYNVLYAYGALLSIDRSYAEKLLEQSTLPLVNQVSVLNRISLMGPETRAFSQGVLQRALEAERETS